MRSSLRSTLLCLAGAAAAAAAYRAGRRAERARIVRAVTSLHRRISVLHAATVAAAAGSGDATDATAPVAARRAVGLLTPAEFARDLHVSLGRVAQWIAEGKIGRTALVVMGGRMLIRRDRVVEDLERAVSPFTAEPTTTARGPT